MEETQKNGVGNDLTEGFVSTKLILFSIPLIGAYLLQSLYCMVDMLIVSRLAGTYSMSAVNIVDQVGQVVNGVAFGYCFGGLFLGTGHSSYVAIANGVGALISRIPLCIVLAHVLGPGVVGIGLAYPITAFFTDITYFYFYFKGDWRPSALSDDRP